MIMQLERITIRSIDLISLSLDMVPGEGWQIYQTNDLLKVEMLVLLVCGSIFGW